MTVISKTISPCAPEKTSCACGECGGLECLCRPRFFAGQLLTEEDLNRLDSYVRTRARMHNLSLHGTGVVNGLKVLCDPCGEVKVTMGHAISPCGDDIIVCEDTSVAICELIRKCRQAERKKADCDPPRRISDRGCEDLDEEWVLAIKYDERPTRGVMPLRTGTCKSCGCGGSTCDCEACDCDACCEGPAAKKSPRPRGAPTECEPTVICEGYRFCVYRKPEPEPRDDDDRGFNFFDPDAPLIVQLECCIKLLTAAFPVVPDGLESGGNTLANRRELHRLCCRFKDNLIGYFSRHPHTNCEILDILGDLRCPDPEQSDGFGQAFLRAFLILFGVWLDAVKQCICLALLPPAPEPTCEDRIALATVRVRGRDCRVLSVCNWTTERDMLISWPSVAYWLGSLGIWDFLREALDTVCCASFVDLFRDVVTDDLTHDAQAEFGVTAAPVGDQATIFSGLSFSTSLDKTWRGALGGMNIDFPTIELARFAGDSAAGMGQPTSLAAILNAAHPKFRFGATDRKLTQLQQDHLPETVVMEFVGKPILSSLMGVGTETRKGRAKAARTVGDDMVELKELVERQQGEIDRLKGAVGLKG